MPNYKCDRCSKSYKFKGDYIRHINRKKLCISNKEEDISDDSIDPANVIHQCITIEPVIVIHQCTLCNKVFSRIDALTRHKAKYCKQQKLDTKIIEAKMTDIVEEMQEMKSKQEKKDLELQQIKEELMRLKEESNMKNVKVSSVQNANNIQNINNHNEIKIIAYGKEDLSFITDLDYSTILNKGFKSVPNLIEFIHFNINKPENQNIYISNMRDNHVLIFDGEKWQLKERNDILQDIIDNKTYFLAEKFDEIYDTLDEGTIKKFKRFLDEKDQDRVIDQIKKDLKLMLYNNKKIKEIKPRYFTSNTNKIIKNDKLDDIKLDDIKLDS